MYKRILVPIDGGKLTERAIHASIELAIQLGASITGFTAGRLPVSLLRRSSDMIEDDDSDDETATAASAHRILAHFASCAEAAGVPYEGVYHQTPRVDQAANRFFSSSMGSERA